MGYIQRIQARQIIDSRGNPTVEVDIVTDAAGFGRAAVPSGASTGAHEAVELRDGGQSYNGKGVQSAVNHINTVIAQHFTQKRFCVRDQQTIDTTLCALDGTANKSKLGANAILGVSLAVARAAAQECKMSLFEYIGGKSANLLPMPMMNILNGGVHADNQIDFQEFMIVPCAADSFAQALQQGVEVFHALKSVLKKRGYAVNVGDEGGFAPQMSSNEEAIETVLEAICQAGYTPQEQIALALDAAATEMYDPNTKRYTFYKSSGNTLSADEMVRYWADWVEKYPIFSIEDGMAEDDWDGWKKLTDTLGAKTQLVGDDLFVTNQKRIQQGITQNIANSLLVKMNQIGTISETIEAVRLAQENGYSTVMSHRSGETEDASIADLAVALHCGQIKTGGLSRSDRMAKYNQLLRIEEQLGSAGRMFRLVR